MIGNSLSFCIRDVVLGKAAESAVEYIRCAHPDPGPAGFEATLALYAQTYWAKDPERAKALAWRLRLAGKLFYTGGHYLTAVWDAGGPLALDPPRPYARPACQYELSGRLFYRLEYTPPGRAVATAYHFTADDRAAADRIAANWLAREDLLAKDD